MIFKNGVDRHAYYRVNPDLNFVRVMHFSYPGGYSIYNGSNSVGFNRGYVANITYHYKVIVTTSNVKVYESSDINPALSLISDVNQIIPMPAGFIGLGSSPGSSTFTQTWFDNVRVTTLDHSDLENGLNVPLFKQTNPLWASDIYDSANQWAPLSPGINRWGCAITSATMVLQYHNINKLPNGNSLDPGTLNTYLKSIPDGYVRNGLTNWQAIAVMSKNAKPQNPGFSFDSLEYSRGSNDVSLLQADIDNNIPNILEVSLSNGGSHFVVAKGVDEGEVLIHDPGFDREDLSGYQDTFLSTRRLVPSNTDLSYMMFVVDPDVDIMLKDEEGFSVGSLVLESPVEDPLGLLSNSQGPLKVVHLSKPLSGNYSLVISSPSDNDYQLEGYLYDENGQVKLFSSSGVVGGDDDRYEFSFSKANIEDTTAIQIVTFNSLLNDLDELRRLGHFKNNGSYVSLKSIVGNAHRKTSKDAKKLLSNLQQDLLEGGKEGVDEFARQYLIERLSILISQI